MASCINGRHSLRSIFVLVTVLVLLLVLVLNISHTVKRGNLARYKPTWSTSSNYHGNVSYMLALHYAEQFTSSTAHYIQFLNLAAGWKFTGVEPFIRKSRMFGVRAPNRTNVKFSLLLNMSTLINELSLCLKKGKRWDPKEKPILVQSMNEFLEHSYRSIAVVYFMKHMRIFSKNIHDGMDYGVKFDKEPIVDCTAIAREKGLSEAVEVRLNLQLHSSMNENLHINKSSNVEFYVERAFCIHNTMNATLIQIMDYIHRNIEHREYSTSRRLASVVFVSWQGQYTRKMFADRSTMDRCRLSPKQIVHSTTVQKAAKRFIHSIGLKTNSYLSVHIRFEHLFESARKNNSELFYQCTIMKLNILIGKMSQRYNLSLDSAVLVTKDYGPYGSDSCHYEGVWRSVSVCINKTNKLLSKLAVKSAEFEPVNFGLPPNSGLVSLVEADSLLYGRALIVVGGGSYQHSIAEQFKSTHGPSDTASLSAKSILDYSHHDGSAKCITE